MFVMDVCNSMRAFLTICLCLTWITDSVDTIEIDPVLNKVPPEQRHAGSFNRWKADPEIGKIKFISELEPEGERNPPSRNNEMRRVKTEEFGGGGVNIDASGGTGESQRDGLWGGERRAGGVKFAPREAVRSTPRWSRWARTSSTRGPISTATPSTPPTPAARPEMSDKKVVTWFDDTLYYGLKASADQKFKIRHAPIARLGAPWPMPQTYRATNTTFIVNPLTFKFNIIGQNCDQVLVNIERIKRNIFGSSADKFASDPEFVSGNERASDQSLRELKYLNISVVSDCEKYPHLEMNESYDLDVLSRGAVIRSDQVWGALRAMETFSQLVYNREDDEQFYINETYIRDFPRFKHRGLLLDTSRHYIDKTTLLENLEAMAQNKLNVFHWHIVDDQSFPFQSHTFPNLTRMGAYNARTHIYTHEDIAEIIEAARFLGIRVIPEFDTPGHTFSWGFGMNHLLTPCYSGDKPNGLYGPINPILKKNYRFLQALFREITSVFKDRFFHIGGDEVPFSCWYTNPGILNFMKKNNIMDMNEILVMYGREIQKILENIRKTRQQGLSTIVWQELFESKVEIKNDTIVQVWNGDSYLMQQVARAGKSFIFSSCWYLDYIQYGQDWDKYYRCEQINMDNTDYRINGTSLLIGGEVCLWMEHVDDAVLMPRLWPRAAAAAERLWSDRYLTDVHEAGPRLEAQRCRMLSRGLSVGVASGPGYCPHHQSEILKNKQKRSSSQLAESRENYRFNIVKQGFLHASTTEEGGFKLAYILPMLAVVVVLLVLLASSRHTFRYRLLLPTGAVPRRLAFVFLLFTAIWCVWFLPFSTHDFMQSRVPKR